MRSSNNDNILLLIVLAVLLVIFLGNLMLGSANIPIKQVLNILVGNDVEKNTWRIIVMDSRLPQAHTALFTGGGLALAGLLMQTLFNNYLAGPSVLGISSGSSLFVSICVIFLGITSSFSIAFSAILGSVLVLLLIVFFARKIKSNLTLLIIGLMLSFITSSIVSVLELYSSKESLQLFILWGLGSFSNISWDVLPYFSGLILTCLALSLLLSKPLNAMLLGNDYAKSLGVNVSAYRIFLLIITGVITGVTTAFCGPIGFLGLAIPHVSRILTNKLNHLNLIPLTFLVGAIFGLICDSIARLPGSSHVLPINGVTALIGAPIVIWVIIKTKRTN